MTDTDDDIEQAQALQQDIELLGNSAPEALKDDVAELAGADDYEEAVVELQSLEDTYGVQGDGGGGTVAEQSAAADFRRAMEIREDIETLGESASDGLREHVADLVGTDTYGQAVDLLDAATLNDDGSVSF